MQLTGVPLQTVLIAAGVAAAVITAFYLMKLRHRRVEVPFNQLWADVLAERRRERDLWRQLRRILSWLLQIVLVALLGFALLDPRPPGESVEGRHVLLLLDRSASMGATDITGDSSRFQQAKRRTRDLLGTLDSDDRVMLGTFDREVLPQTTFVSEPSRVSEPLGALDVTDTGTNYRRVARFISDTLRGRSRPHAIVLTDGAGTRPDADPFGALPENIDVRHLKVGAGSGNAAITQFNARRYPSNKLDYELYVEVRSSFERPVEAALQLYADGQQVDTKRIRLPADGTVQRFFPSQAVSGTKLHARLKVTTPDAVDDSPRDDRAYAVLPKLESPDVLLVSEDNLYLEGALLLNPNIRLQKASPGAWRESLSTDTDIIVFDGVAPKPPKRVDALYLAPSGDSSPWRIRGNTEAPVVDSVNRNHPLMRWVYFDELNIASAARIVPGPADEVVVSGPAGPLLLAREENDRRLAALAFDPTASDLPLRVAFPMLMFNVVDWMELSETRYEPPRPTGQTWRVPLDATDVSEATVTTPTGQTHDVPVSDGVAYVRGLSTGFYTLDTETSTQLIAANLGDPDEVDIEPRRLRPDVQEASATSPTIFDRGRYWLWAVLLAGILVLVEWWSYHRRWTV